MGADPIFSYALNDGVHHIAPLQATGDAIKEMLAHIEGVFIDWPPEERVRVVVDFRPAGPAPMAEGIPHLLAFFRRQGHRTTQPARIAYIYPRSAQGRILTGFLGIQRFLPQRVTVRFFVEGEQQKALEWLHA